MCNKNKLCQISAGDIEHYVQRRYIRKRLEDTINYFGYERDWTLVGKLFLIK